MREFFIEPWNTDCLKCKLYTVRFTDEDISETDKFFEKFLSDANTKESALILLKFVNEIIGNRYGGVNALFNREENDVTGLPNKGKFETYHFPNFPIRLYALRLCPEVIVLFTGGKKDGRTNQTSNTSSSWYLSCHFARIILKAINEGVIYLDRNNKTLTNFWKKCQSFYPNQT